MVTLPCKSPKHKAHLETCREKALATNKGSSLKKQNVRHFGHGRFGLGRFGHGRFGQAIFKGGRFGQIYFWIRFSMNKHP